MIGYGTTRAVITPTTIHWIAVNAVSMAKKSRMEVIGLFAAAATVVKLHESKPPSAAYVAAALGLVPNTPVGASEHAQKSTGRSLRSHGNVVSLSRRLIGK